jgi:hypothetical protein
VFSMIPVSPNIRASRTASFSTRLIADRIAARA